MTKAAYAEVMRCVAEINKIEARGETAVLTRTEEGYRYMPNRIGEIERIDLGHGYIVEKHHTDAGIDVDVRHLGVSMKTMRRVADLRQLLGAVTLRLLRQRDEARARLATSEHVRRSEAASHRREIAASNELNAGPICTKPGGSPPGIGDPGPGLRGIDWPTPAVLVAYGIGVLSGGVAAFIILLSQQG